MTFFRCWWSHRGDIYNCDTTGYFYGDNFKRQDIYFITDFVDSTANRVREDDTQKGPQTRTGTWDCCSEDKASVHETSSLPAELMNQSM